MEIVDIIRNSLIDSGKFNKVKYDGKNEIWITSRDKHYCIKVDEYEGLGALFG